MATCAGVCYKLSRLPGTNGASCAFAEQVFWPNIPKGLPRIVQKQLKTTDHGLVCCSFGAPRLERWSGGRTDSYLQCGERGGPSHSTTSTECLSLFAAAIHRPSSVSAAVHPSTPFPTSTPSGASNLPLSAVPASPCSAVTVTGKTDHEL
jgi:hypothetical protein